MAAPSYPISLFTRFTGPHSLQLYFLVRPLLCCTQTASKPPFASVVDILVIDPISAACIHDDGKGERNDDLSMDFISQWLSQ